MNLAEVIGDAIVRTERIQSLWSGYGELLRVHSRNGSTLIAKWVKPPARRDDVSHARKCRSYAVETAWYRGLAARCDDTCRVPALVAAREEEREWLIVLEDLDAVGFSKRRHRLDDGEMRLCLEWLAAFHGRFLGVEPEGLWKIGTYWHLETRRDELAAMDDDALRTAAPELDRQLRAATFQTIVHGDAKPANFCFGARAVAAVDFQYVGGGCGMKDVAYLINGSPHAARYLDIYFDRLRESVSGVDGDALEAEWRELYPVACADYARFMNGWRRLG